MSARGPLRAPSLLAAAMVGFAGSASSCDLSPCSWANPPPVSSCSREGHLGQRTPVLAMEAPPPLWPPPRYSPMRPSATQARLVIRASFRPTMSLCADQDP